MRQWIVHLPDKSDLLVTVWVDEQGRIASMEASTRFDSTRWNRPLPTTEVQP